MLASEKGGSGSETREGDGRVGQPVAKAVVSALAGAFVMGVIVFSFLSFNYQNIQMLNFPVSSSGQVCNLQFALSFPYLYIDLSAPAPRYRCVDACPSGWNQFVIADSAGQEIYCSGGEEVDAQMGGICWSAEKKAALLERGLLDELTFKEDILGQLKSILIILVAAFLLSSAALPLFYCLPQSVNYFASVATAALLLAAAIVFLTLHAPHQTALIITLVVITLIFIANVVCWGEKLSQSAGYTTRTLQLVQEGGSVPILLKSSLILLVFNVANLVFLCVVLLQLVALVSSQQLQRQPLQLFLTAEKTWWKYVLLFLEWFMVSHFLKELFAFTLVRLGCQINPQRQADLACCTLTSIANIAVFSLMLALLWLPLRLIDFFKPNGAVIREREREEETCGHQISRAAYCCCGYFINKLHRYCFNPYLVAALPDELVDIEGALRTVQQSYHCHDGRYDRSSLWIYRLSNYITIIVLSAACMALSGGSQAGLPPGHLLFFYVMGAVVAIEVSRLNLNFWSGLVEVTEFIAINAPS